MFADIEIVRLDPFLGPPDRAGDEPVLVTSAIGKAQKRVEAHNFDIRKHLLEYDNVMNKQREEVYRQRDEALLSTDISARVLEDLRDAASERSERFVEDRVHR